MGVPRARMRRSAVVSDRTADDPVDGWSGHAGAAVLRLFDESPDARLLMTRDRRVLLMNGACEQLFGRTRDELIGHPARVLTSPRLWEEYDRVYQALIGTETAGTVSVNLSGLHSDGREIPIRLVARVLVVGSGEPILSLVVIDRRQPEGENGRLRDFLEAVHDGNLIVDAEGRIMMATARLQEMFGYREDELIGHQVEMLSPPERRQLHTNERQRITDLASGGLMTMGNRFIAMRKDGTTFPVRVILSSLGYGGDVLISASVRDLSELDALVGESDRLKDQFLANVSHELRTPLTSIMGSAEMLSDEVARIEDQVLRARLERFTGLISRGARRQLALVEDLLALTSIDRGDARPEGDLTDLMVLVENVVHDYGPRAEAAGIDLDTETDGPPILVHADERWLGRAVDCLVSNAVKFTPAGGRIVVSAGIRGERAWLEVLDTGPGIPPEEAELVFQRLYRGSAAVIGVTQGAGLGLAIARSVVAACGGTLRVVPHEGSGTRLRIALPAVDLGRVTATPESAEPAEVSLP